MHREVKSTALGHLVHKWHSFIQQIFMEGLLYAKQWGDLTWVWDWDLSLLTSELMLFLLCQQPWQRSYMRASVLVPRGSGDDSVPALPPTHRSPHCPKHHTWSQKAGWPAALSAHTKDNSPFQPQMWPRGPGCSCIPLPSRAGVAYRADLQDSA